jgi:uroporphyrinogen-III decarboxylase
MPEPDAIVDSRALVLAHLDGRRVDRLPAMPITMMFAARLAGIPYRQYCTDFRLLARAQTLVAERFGFDHVSAISDPAREAVDLGAAVTWFDDQPPALDDTHALLADKRVLASLVPADPLAGGRMTDRVRGVELLRATAGRTRLVEGWVEGPCAEAADLRGISALMLDFADADDVGPAIYREVVLPHEGRLVDAVHAMGARVRLHICGNTRRSVGAMAGLGADIVDLDYPVPLGQARLDAGPEQVLLGNLNPVAGLLSSTPAAIRDAMAACHRDAGSRYIAGAGCEIPVSTPHEHVDALAGYARSVRPDGSPAGIGS